MKRIFLAFAGMCLVTTLLFPAGAPASQVIGVNMSDLMTADVIFLGTCKAKDAHIKDGRLETTYTFSVVVPDGVMKAPEGLFKGTGTQDFPFTQVGASRADAQRLNVPAPPGIPNYEVGKEYMLYLTSESSGGYRAPIGLGQGKFNVIQGADGKKQVVNDYGNKSLFLNLPASKSMTKALSIGGAQSGQQGPVDLDSFQKMIRELNQPTRSE